MNCCANCCSNCVVLLLRDGDDDSVKDGDAGLDVATLGFDVR